MTLARNTEAYNLLKGLVESYGANVVRDTILHIVGTGDLTDPTNVRHLEGGLRPYTVDERAVSPAPPGHGMTFTVRTGRP